MDFLSFFATGKIIRRSRDFPILVGWRGSIKSLTIEYCARVPCSFVRSWHGLVSVFPSRHHAIYRSTTFFV